jgi:periplasmic divalent cation tolerance protein
MQETDALIVMTTLEQAADGERLAHLLVERELAACVQILPRMTSVYRWQGAVEQAAEHLLLIKTTRAAFPRLEAAVRENHPYETPEVIAIPIAAGSAPYLAWLFDSVPPAPPNGPPCVR